MSVHRQMAEGEARFLGQKPVQHRFYLVQMAGLPGEVGMAGRGVGTLDDQQLPQRFLAQLPQHPAHRLFRGLDLPHVPCNEQLDALGGLFVEPQPSGDVRRQRRTQGVVAVEMALSRFVHGEAPGLAQIVQQQRPAQQGLFRCGGHRMGGVGPDIVQMVHILLVKPHAGQDLRQKSAENPGIGQQHLQSAVAAEELGHLLPDALGGDVAQQGRTVFHSRRRLLLDGKAQHGGKAQAAQDPQSVLAESRFRIAHTAQKALFQVLPAAVEVVYRTPQVHGHGVDGEVTPPQIFLQRVGKLHAVGAAMVGVGAVGTEGGHFKGLPILPHRHGAVLQAGGDGAAVKEGQHVLGPGGGGDVVVVGGDEAQHVPDAAAHGIGRKACRFQAGQYIFHFLRQHPHHPFLYFRLHKFVK